MKLTFIRKLQEFDETGQPSSTKVILGNTDGALFPVFLNAEKINLSNTKLLNLALEKIYEENFPQRAENEKFNLFGSKIAEVDATIEKANKKIEEMTTQMTSQRTQSAVAQKTILDLLTLLYTKGLINDEDFTKLTQ
ncbi:hypothetical protein HMPREF9318_00102 [Streptococcus urinalis FB127-CNA-2]|uniref:DUF1366 domain-containing protein n=1 Tax=Streptococcus urinalis 2285-97 TaxID=764291 RepID=G5KEK7_9STRE|nr:DUF1366 domain-containing protein [Streptococcus urinalis]QBX22165.1 hypothetical protein Javan637_0057 [Streptococcus phage Javan637]QBX31621.1 hypothetical protein Javan642_0057 [Streptococcus phage Javan642]QBX31634.1 hypothetical protein Javan648_0008 [Streptococcus phage Javan648]EHJ57320.1 hypothetical protein STRUR_0842 [Streptococcus urinalis 2285-97]EKS21904.1 hypothetical protein HMPREF9318_00102 [Streptococcus urinalis FB127-CNA-2]